jgi:protein-L-isoaspartate(D-aspartate) O-methyltransferase
MTSQLRERLVATLRERGALHDAAVERAFLTVPREIFLPGLSLDVVYRDEAILTKVEDGIGVSSSSQPAMMALMLEQLLLFAGARVLEIGAGTGYNAAILREVVGDHGEVITLDIDAEVAGWAAERLEAAGYDDVSVRCVDGADGWPERAPFDRIELTVGADDISPAWHEQLVEAGILVIPLWVRTGQISVAFQRRGDSFVSRSVQPCGFIALRGRMAAEPSLVDIGDGVVAAIGDPDEVSEVRALLRRPLSSSRWDGHLWDGFSFFAGLWDLPIFSMWAGNSENAFIRGGGFALLDPQSHGLALVATPSGDVSPCLLAYGNTSAADTLRSAFERWDVLGRPDVGDLQLIAHPRDAAPPPGPADAAVDTRLWRLLITRRNGPLR